MNQLKNSEIIDRVIELKNMKKWPDYISKQLTKELQRDVPIETIKEILTQLKNAKKLIQNNTDILDKIDTKSLEKQDGGLKDMVADTIDARPYEFDYDTDHYIFHIAWKSKLVLRTTIMAMFDSYTRTGENLTGADMLSKFKLSPEVWNHIRNATGLQKQSVPFDPVTVGMQWSNPEMEAIATEKAQILKEAEMRKIYQNAEQSFLKGAVKKYAKTNHWYDLFISKLEEVLKTYKPIDFDKIKVPEIKNDDTKDVFITDAHLGKKWTDGIILRFKKLTRDILETPEKNINITFGGDIGECFLPIWEMHPWQRLWMEEVNTEQLIMLAVDVLKDMLTELYKGGKTVTFNWIGGNHWRITEKKEFDPFRSAEMVIYRFLERLVADTTIKVNILRERANEIKSGKVKYVFIHWDSMWEAELKRRALNDIEDWYYLCYVTGDKHHFRMMEMSDRVMWIQSPALAWQWQYDKSLWMSSQSGAIFFEKNKDWMLEFTLKRYL